MSICDFTCQRPGSQVVIILRDGTGETSGIGTITFGRILGDAGLVLPKWEVIKIVRLALPLTLVLDYCLSM